jgi:hypothetical protein
MDTIKETSKRKKKRARKTEEYCSYVVEITDWGLANSFSMNWNEKLFDGPYFETLNLEVNGLIRTTVKYACRSIHATFLGDRRLPPDPCDQESVNRKPRCMGMITLGGETREFLGAAI